MADTYAFGIAASSTGSITGTVVEAYEVSATASEKDLTGNNAGQTVVDSRYTNKKQTLHVVFEFTSGSADMPIDLIGSSFTATATSDNTSATALTMTGNISDAKLIAHKDDWWQYDLTITQVT